MQCVPFSTAKVRIVNGDDLAEDRGKSGGSPHADERDIGVRVRVCKSFGQYSSTPRRSIGRYSTRTEDSNQQNTYKVQARALYGCLLPRRGRKVTTGTPKMRDVTRSFFFRK